MNDDAQTAGGPGADFMVGDVPWKQTWQQALERAGRMVGLRRGWPMNETCWDDVAIRGICAVVLYSLAVRDGVPVSEVPAIAVVESCGGEYGQPEFIELLALDVLPGAGHRLDGTGSDDPVAATWTWLNRRWPEPPDGGYLAVEAGPYGYRRWGGLTRGIAPGLEDPALQVCTLWAASAAHEEATRGRDETAARP